tara:strand:+ start:860 stop:1168 length:309 start_codon:yes stop_codon:yes gene_type:complete
MLHGLKNLGVPRTVVTPVRRFNGDLPGGGGIPNKKFSQKSGGPFHLHRCFWAQAIDGSLVDSGDLTGGEALSRELHARLQRLGKGRRITNLAMGVKKPGVFL